MKSNCTIRRGRPSDLGQILELDRQLLAYDVSFDPSLDTGWSSTEEAHTFYSCRLSGQEGAAFVAESDAGSLAGFLVGAEVAAESYRRPLKLAEIECLYIDESYRGLRIGQRLMDAFAEWAREQGVERLSVTVSARNRGARDFYERLGYGDYDVVLEKSLND